MSQHPDFVAVWKRYDERLTPGQRAEIRRAAAPDDPAVVFATGRSFTDLLAPWPSSYRVVWFLPFVGHRDDGVRLGRQFAEADISELRMFQMLRSEFPADLQHLRRLCRRVEPVVDWNEFGKTLWWWDPYRESKERIVEDYFWGKKEEK